MKPYNFVSAVADSKCRRSCLCSLFPAASMLCLFFFIWTAFIAQDHKQNLLRWGSEESMQGSKFNKCKNQCRPLGSETLPEGIFSKTSNLEMRPLWGSPKKNVYSSTNLFSVAVGIRQKKMVDKMVRKFLSSDFVVMLFHYDGIVDEWKDLEWSDLVIHVSAVNQTKWWFAKRFLHPDIAAEYSYIFLWDEDLGVENFNPERYISIVKDEGLEISQPALDVAKSEVHHQITARGRRSNVHRRTYKSGDHGIECDGNSTTPPCTGWIEVMAPVFSRAAWRCVWYMIQNDLIHAWGLDMQLGYCAQGDRTKNIGVVDSEYIVHYGLPTLGESENKTNLATHDNTSETKNVASLETRASSRSHEINYRIEVRRQSYNEFQVFKRRWRHAADQDKCWIDPYPESVK
uniref:Lysine ketoglutarate reductase trans-splicing-like protein n=1 Tax=Davidia involucrata TaxID=16924 RepID=A0A5B7B9L5_DAVIN